MSKNSAKRASNKSDSKGNTNQESRQKQVCKAKKWCFTYNLYPEEEIEPIVLKFKDNCEKYIFSREVGEKKGTRHLQGFIVLKDKMRPTELKLNKRIHWEKCKGSEQDNIKYCSKERTAVWKSDNIILSRPLKLITPDRPYQEFILRNIVRTEPDDRKIYWFYDKYGNVGKSAFCKYLVAKHDCLILTEGKKSDIINMVYNYTENKNLDLVVLDIPRSNESVSYKSLEEIKNGLIVNTKYETGSRVINAPHIIVFCNFFPDVEQFSTDRWHIYQIDKKFRCVREAYDKYDEKQYFDSDSD